jgi:Fe-Mn family superoxide dismutase
MDIARRKLIKNSLIIAGGTMALNSVGLKVKACEMHRQQNARGAFRLEKLPYELDALSPYISKEAMRLHYGEHHAAYVKNLNELVTGTPYAKMSLTEIMHTTEAQSNELAYKTFNNAAQVYNHDILWQSMHPNGGDKPTGELAKAIDKTYGNFDNFKATFLKEATGLFGSGWLWLAKQKTGEIALIPTPNAGNPITNGDKILLGFDVWEHAYYVDYRGERAKYANVFLDKLANWDYAAAQFSAKIL